MAVLPWPIVLFQFLFILPGYDRLFREYGLKVDSITGLLLNVSAWLWANNLPAFLIAFVLMGLSIGTAHMVQSASVSRVRRVAILLFVFGVPSGVFLATWMSVQNTHRTLVEGLRR